MDMTEPGYASVDRWLASLNPSTGRTYGWHFEKFLKWVRVNGGKFKDYTPDMLIDYVKHGSVDQVNEVLDLKKFYLLEQRGRLNYKLNMDKAIRSFFANNRAELPRDKTLNLRGDSPRVRGELTPQDVRAVVLSSSKLYRAVFLCMLQGGFGQDEFIRWSNTGLEKLMRDLKDDPETVCIEIPGRKNQKNTYSYYTFIGGDAIKALRDYLKIRPAREAKSGRKQDAIFLNQFGEPLTKVSLYRYWTRKLKQLGIIQPDKHQDGRYGRNPHEIRDVFRTLYRRSGASPEFAEFFMGHTQAFDKFGYDKIYRDRRFTEREYRKALPWLQILSSSRPFGKVDEDEMEALRRKVRELEAGRDRELDELRRRLDGQEKINEEIRQQLHDLFEALEKFKGNKPDTSRG